MDPPPHPSHDAYHHDGRNHVDYDGDLEESPLGAPEVYYHNDSGNHDSTIMMAREAGGGGKNRRKYVMGGMIAIVMVVVIAIVAVVGSGGGRKSASNAAQGAGSGDGGNLSADQQSALEALIRSVAPDGGDSFANPNSYQTKALKWLEGSETAVTVSSTNKTLTADERNIQRYALACIFFATNGVRTIFTDFQLDQTGLQNVVVPGWLNKNHWPQESDESPDECTWHGVVCDGNGYVEEIQLESNLLTGSMPPETVLLKSSLKVLNVANTMVYNVGDPGNNWLGDLTELEYLFISDTSFQYNGLPPAMGRLTNLKGLDCSYTLYFGPLRPEIFTNLVKLEYLYIGGNSFNSTVPSTITKLPKLRSFYSEYSDITGTLDFMVGMPAIFELWIDRNPQLTGTIPAAIGTLSTLASFSVTSCNLNGPLPTQMGLLTNMKQMWLYDNHLNGTIPTELARMTLLDKLELEVNDFTGDLTATSGTPGICNSLIYPQGSLQTFVTDCDGEVTCPTDCCTCCGASCISAAVRKLEVHEQQQHPAVQSKLDSHDPPHYQQYHSRREVQGSRAAGRLSKEDRRALSAAATASTNHK